MSNSIKSFTANDNTNWHYFDGSFWATTVFEGNTCLMACPACADGTPDIDISGNVNACDVDECEQRHLDFVNNIFNTNFELRGVADSGIGEPTYG